MIKLIKAAIVSGVVLTGIVLAIKSKKKPNSLKDLTKHTKITPDEFRTWAE